MAVSEVIYAQGDGPGGQWVFRGPALFADPAKGHTAWERVLRTGLQSLMADVQRAARAAYSDVPSVRDGFIYTAQTSPYVRGQLLATADKFRVIEGPTRPHEIIAHNALYNWLVFQIDGHWVRVKRVHHPGTKGRNAITPIFDRAAERFQALCDAAVEAMLAV